MRSAFHGQSLLRKNLFEALKTNSEWFVLHEKEKTIGLSKNMVLNVTLSEMEISVSAYKLAHLDKFKREQEYMAKTFDFHELNVLDKNELTSELNTSFYHGGRTNERSAHYHPLKFARALANLAEEMDAAVKNVTKTITCPPNSVSNLS